MKPEYYFIGPTSLRYFYKVLNINMCKPTLIDAITDYDPSHRTHTITPSTIVKAINNNKVMQNTIKIGQNTSKACSVVQYLKTMELR